MRQMEGDYAPSPIDDLEPILLSEHDEAYKLAARHFLKVMQSLMGLMKDERSVLWWQIQFALGTPFCMGQSMNTVAQSLGVTRAAISKGAVDICNRLGLPPSYYMKSEDAREAARETRKEQIR